MNLNPCGNLDQRLVLAVLIVGVSCRQPSFPVPQLRVAPALLGEVQFHFRPTRKESPRWLCAARYVLYFCLFVSLVFVCMCLFSEAEIFFPVTPGLEAFLYLKGNQMVICIPQGTKSNEG